MKCMMDEYLGVGDNGSADLAANVELAAVNVNGNVLGGNVLHLKREFRVNSRQQSFQ